MIMRIRTASSLLLCAAALLPWPVLAAPPRPDHVVVVILENKAYGLIIGSPNAPNINAFAAEGALFANAPSDPSAATSGSHGLRHPSQPNYLEIFSGNNQGVVQDGRPGTLAEPLSLPPPFKTPNLARSLIAAGFSFATYSESMPSVGFDGDAFTTDPTKTQYQRKHNPVANWQAADAPANNHVPVSTNQPFTAFPTDAAGYAALPSVSFVIPNQQHDMHDGSVQDGDAWLKTNILDGYFQWAKAHNSLLIVTFDEDNFDDPTKPAPTNVTNQIATIFAGPMIKRGVYFEANINPPDMRVPDGFITPTGTAMNHYNVLRTLEEMYGVAPLGGSAKVPAITDVFVTVPTTGPLVAPNSLTTTQGDTGNLFPLFSQKPIRYQQVYDKSQFRGAPQMINSIAFRAHSPGKPFSGSVPQLQVSLSTTSKTPDALSSTFVDNVGPNNLQVFNGSLQVVANNSSTPGAVNSFDIVINFTTPFAFDPARGNLLLDIRNLQGGTEEPPLDQELDATNAAADSVSRVFNYGDANAATAGQTGGAPANDTLGLVTQFGTTIAPAPSPSPTPVPNTNLANISTRMITGAGDNVTIGGFIVGVQGSGKKKVVVRGLGPSINNGGAPVAGTVQDPIVQLYKSNGTVLAANDNWKDTQEAEIQQTGLAPKDVRESAISIALDPGAYTVTVSGKAQASGIALVEVYDVDQAGTPKLLNLSTRGNVQTADNVMIAGTIINGSDFARVIFRGLGPSVNSHGVPVPGRLADPTLDLRDANGARLAFNDNWKDTQQAEIQKSGLAPIEDLEAAIIGSYAPGTYTAILRGKNDTTGIGLVEVYKLN